MPRKFDFVSPGVQITEVDQSKLEPSLDDNDGLENQLAAKALLMMMFGAMVTTKVRHTLHTLPKHG